MGLGDRAFCLTKNLFRVQFLHHRALHTTNALNLFYESHPRDGYSKVDEKLKKMTRTERLRFALNIMKEEIVKWKQEMKEKMELDPILEYRFGEPDKVFKFNSKDDLENWVVTSDSDHNEGYSSSNLIITPQGTGLFSGELSTKLIADGRIHATGYCNIRSKRVRKSFLRDSYYDWTPYSHLVIKVKGDGRSYLLNLHCSGPYDVLWNDTYQYMLYTRGGPYWQITKIPFSKFFLSSKGRIQDIQRPIPQTRITNIGITCGDDVNGSFSLEIDYIAVEFDPDHEEEFAYEMYHVGKFIAAE